MGYCEGAYEEVEPLNMKKIEKKEVPDRFKKYAKTKSATYDKLNSDKNKPIKDELRQSLLDEQGHLCCYCGKRVEIKKSVIEHLIPRSENAKLELSYDNLLLSCDGGQSRKRENEKFPASCDHAKGRRKISVSPLEDDCETRYICEETGFILCRKGDEQAEETLQILNLNNHVLVNRRKKVIDGLRHLEEDQECLKEELDYYNKLEEGKYPEFSWAATSYMLNFCDALVEELAGV